MEAVFALGSVWFISKRLFHWETQPLMEPLGTGSNGDQAELVHENQVNRNSKRALLQKVE